MPVASRPVFVPYAKEGLVDERTVTFTWHPGLALAQQQRSVESLHGEAKERGWYPLLEVSTRSLRPLGIRLSAFNLRLTTTDNVSVTVEAAFQSSKVFVDGKSLAHLLTLSDGREIKAQVKEHEGRELERFSFEDRPWPLKPLTAFYDYLYLRALREDCERDSSLISQLTEFAGFTDIAFNPKRSFNCQARACALFVTLCKITSVDALLSDRDRFIDFLLQHHYGETGHRPESMQLSLELPQDSFDDPSAV